MERNNKTMEEKVAETILQKSSEITIDDKTYSVAPPTTATLILASEAVSRLPKVVLAPKRSLKKVCQWPKIAEYWAI